MFADNVVGRGGGSEVFRGNLQDGRVVAVKRLNHGPQSEEEFSIDIEINTSLEHPHIVSLLGYCLESSHRLLVYDYLPEGNLEDHLHGNSLQSLASFSPSVHCLRKVGCIALVHSMWIFEVMVRV